MTMAGLMPEERVVGDTRVRVRRIGGAKEWINEAGEVTADVREAAVFASAFSAVIWLDHHKEHKSLWTWEEYYPVPEPQL